MQPNKESVLKLERMAFEEISFSRDLSSTVKNYEYEMNFTREIAPLEAGDKYKVSLTANVWSKDDAAIRVKVTLVGFFGCEDENEKFKRELLQYNTLAILFPYLRSQLTLISTQPDIAPILVPPVNIIAMFKDVDNQEEQSH